MACTTVPESISNGYYVPVKSSYSAGEQVFYVCSQNYVMSGSPTVTCTSGAWVGEYPSCSLSFLSNGKIYMYIRITRCGIITNEKTIHKTPNNTEINNQRLPNS